MMTAAAESLGGAAPSQLDSRRALLAVSEAAEALAAVCRRLDVQPSEVAAAERRLSGAFAAYGGLVLMARAAR